jgi:O-antigen biosynthesis protein
MDDHRAVGAAVERFEPASMSGDLIDAEHQARYRLALPFVAGRRVLDAGCGVGWGSALLAAAGATDVIGVDIAPEAIRASRDSCPSGRFLVGDLGRLPLAADSVDVVVCLETLEHTSDVACTLVELRRVLRPDGVLVVSSPNPAVYPAGNPFHVRELRPEELLAEVQARFGPSQLWRQHLMVSSLLYPDAAVVDGELRVRARSVSALRPGHDPYSVVVAGAAGGDEGVLMVAPSHQLDALSTLTAAVHEEREAIRVDHERILAERERLLAEHASAQVRAEELARSAEAAHGQLGAADVALRQLTAERDSAEAALAEERIATAAVRADAEARLAAAQAAADAAGTRGEEALGRARRSEQMARDQGADLDRLRSRLARLTAERDQAMVDAVRAEQLAARIGAPRAADEDGDDRMTVLTDRIRLLGDQVDLVRDELDRVQATVSWRVTAPLRKVRRAASRPEG